MAAVSEWVVREYFEMLGYLVNQPRKYIPGRQKTADEEIDLVVLRPGVHEHRVPAHLVWHAADLEHVARAVVGVRGWHAERFYLKTFESTPELLRFVEEAPMRFASSLLGEGPVARILCVPKLPASGELKQATIRFLKARGIDGVISFPTMLSEMVRRVDAATNYEKSDLLQVLRLLKNYDLLREDQMELFVKRTRRRRTKQG
jgi:hypothetical protein